MSNDPAMWYDNTSCSSMLPCFGSNSSRDWPNQANSLSRRTRNWPNPQHVRPTTSGQPRPDFRRTQPTSFGRAQPTFGPTNHKSGGNHHGFRKATLRPTEPCPIRSNNKRGQAQPNCRRAHSDFDGITPPNKSWSRHPQCSRAAACSRHGSAECVCGVCGGIIAQRQV